MTTVTAFDNLIDFLLNHSDDYRRSYKDMRTEDGRMCCFGAYFDHAFVKNGEARWKLNNNYDDEFGKWMISVENSDNYFDLVIDGEVKTELCTLNDTTMLSFREIGERMQELRDNFELVEYAREH